MSVERTAVSKFSLRSFGPPRRTALVVICAGSRLPTTGADYGRSRLPPVRGRTSVEVESSYRLRKAANASASTTGTGTLAFFMVAMQVPTAVAFNVLFFAVEVDVSFLSYQMGGRKGRR